MVAGSKVLASRVGGDGVSCCGQAAEASPVDGGWWRRQSAAVSGEAVAASSVGGWGRDGGASPVGGGCVCYAGSRGSGWVVLGSDLFLFQLVQEDPIGSYIGRAMI